jgi:hypothetical protein
MKLYFIVKTLDLQLPFTVKKHESLFRPLSNKLLRLQLKQHIKTR